jgi:hypothetical protein
LTEYSSPNKRENKKPTYEEEYPIELSLTGKNTIVPRAAMDMKPRERAIVRRREFNIDFGRSFSTFAVDSLRTAKNRIDTTSPRTGNVANTTLHPT